MYASIRRYRVQPDRYEQLEREAREDFLPRIRQQAGFSDYYWIRLGNDAFLTVSLFEEQAQAEASAKLARRWLEERKLISAFVGQADISSGEISFEGHLGAGAEPSFRQASAPPPVH